MLVTAAQLLRQHTQRTHARVEAGLDLLDPQLSLDRLRVVVTRMAGFWSGSEPAIDAWSQRRPDLAARLDWPGRRRSALLHSDVDRLGGAADAVAPPVCRSFDDADVLGWLYVAEGSTLGGAIVDRRLRALTGGARLHLASFTPYEEGPGPMWRAYLAVLEEWTTDTARLAAVVAAGERTFTALADWLEPVFAREGSDRTTVSA